MVAEHQQELLNNLYREIRSFDRDARPPLREIVVLTVRANFATKAYVAVFRDQATPPEQSFTQFVEELRVRGSEIGVEVGVTTHSTTPWDEDELTSALRRFGSPSLREEIAMTHVMRMYEAYTNAKQRERALSHAAVAMQIIPGQGDSETWNNMGYVFLTTGNVERAETCFRRALLDELDSSVVLARINLCALAWVRKDLAGAKTALAEARTAHATFGAAVAATCLMLPADGARFELAESWNVTAEQAFSAFDEVFGGDGTSDNGGTHLPAATAP